MLTFQPGQEVYLSGPRATPPNGVYEVDSVGKKYFTLKDVPRKKFLLADGMEHSSGGCARPKRVWPTEAEYLDSVERNRLAEVIHQLGTSKLRKVSLENLRQAASLLGVEDVAD